MNRVESKGVPSRLVTEKMKSGGHGAVVSEDVTLESSKVWMSAGASTV